MGFHVDGFHAVQNLLMKRLDRETHEIEVSEYELNGRNVLVNNSKD